MKNLTIVSLAVWGLLSLISCSDDIDPDVATIYVESGSRDTLRSQAFAKLYQFYDESDKSKNYYEVIARKSDDFIVNYYPDGKLLTVCEDPGSGWSDQVENVSMNELTRLIDQKVTLGDLRHLVYMDSTLKDVSPMIPVRTNGNPSL